MSLPAVIQIQFENLIEQLIEEGMSQEDAEFAAIKIMVEQESNQYSFANPFSFLLWLKKTKKGKN